LQGLVPLPEGLSDLKYDQGTGGQVFRISRRPGLRHDASDAPKVSLDDQKLAAALAAHPQHRGRPAPAAPAWTACLWSSRHTAAHRHQPEHRRHPVAGTQWRHAGLEVRNNPALKGVTIPQTGNSANVGEVVTKNLVIQGDGEYVDRPGPSARRLSAGLGPEERRASRRRLYAGAADPVRPCPTAMMASNTSWSRSRAATIRAIISPTPCRTASKFNSGGPRTRPAGHWLFNLVLFCWRDDRCTRISFGFPGTIDL
jgi:hypothetical protein